jgi:hypothetical protein
MGGADGVLLEVAVQTFGFVVDRMTVPFVTIAAGAPIAPSLVQLLYKRHLKER